MEKEKNENNNNKDNKENEEKGDSSTSNFVKGIWALLGVTFAGIGGKMIYDNYIESQKSEIQESSGSSILKYEGLDERDQLILKLKKQRSLKPKIISNEFDKNYILSSSMKDDEYDEEGNEKTKLLICPITKKIMEDPVITPYGTTYEKSAIIDWIKRYKTDYNTQKKLTQNMLVTNYIIKTAIKEYNESLKL